MTWNKVSKKDANWTKEDKIYMGWLLNGWLIYGWLVISQDLYNEISKSTSNWNKVSKEVI